MKRMGVLLISLLLLLTTIFTGCQNASEKAKDTSSDKQAQESKVDENEETKKVNETEKEDNSEEPKKTVSLEYYLGGTPQEKADDVYKEVNKIMEEKIGVNINFHFIDWNNYGKQMSMLLASGTNIDLMFTSNWANDFYSDVSKGAYKELDINMIKELAPNVMEEVSEGAWEAGKINGKLYAIPNVQVQARWPGIIVQKKYVDKYKFDTSKVNELDDFTPLFESIAKGEEGIYPIDIKKNTGMLSFYLSKMGLEYFSETNPFGIAIDDKDLKVINLYETEQMKKFLGTLRGWYKSGIIRADAASVSDTSAEKQNGKLAAIFAVNNPDTIVNQGRLMGLEPEELVMVTLSDPYLSTSSVVATMTAINSNSKHVEEAIKTMNVLFDKEDNRCTNLISFGIKDVNYKQIEEDLIEIIPDSGYYVDCGWEYGSLFNTMRTNVAQPKWRPTGPDINKRAIVSPIMGFSLDSTVIKSELARIAAVMDQYIPALLTGSADVETVLPDFLAKLEKAGASKIRDEIQKQIDSWKKTK